VAQPDPFSCWQVLSSWRAQNHKWSSTRSRCRFALSEEGRYLIIEFCPALSRPAASIANDLAVTPWSYRANSLLRMRHPGRRGRSGSAPDEASSTSSSEQNRPPSTVRNRARHRSSQDRSGAHPATQSPPCAASVLDHPHRTRGIVIGASMHRTPLGRPRRGCTRRPAPRSGVHSRTFGTPPHCEIRSSRTASNRPSWTAGARSRKASGRTQNIAGWSPETAANLDARAHRLCDTLLRGTQPAPLSEFWC